MDQDLPYFYNDNFSRNLKILDEIYMERSVIAAVQAVAGPHQCAAQRQAECGRSPQGHRDQDEQILPGQ